MCLPVDEPPPDEHLLYYNDANLLPANEEATLAAVCAGPPEGYPTGQLWPVESGLSAGDCLSVDEPRVDPSASDGLLQVLRNIRVRQVPDFAVRRPPSHRR
uniref:(northern house mosquito) hypothetical protein n=1 Tax=Culex pipiens TaxID=7175 RepID=A0A8D8JKI7_CULPI